MTRERPILFSGPMVLAILAGTKTQTRRVVRPALHPLTDAVASRGGGEFAPIVAGYELGEYPAERVRRCPYGVPEDRLWVREACALVPSSAYRSSAGVQQAVNPGDPDQAAIYREGFDRARGGLRWRPSIHMPRWASRLTLELVAVRVQRLQEITEEDARAEGAEIEWRDVDGRSIYGFNGGLGFGLAGQAYSAREAFATAWDAINGKRDGCCSWAANPWVWAITFRRLELEAGS